MVEYSKNLFTCKFLDGKVMDSRYKVVEGVIYSHDKIYLTRDSKLKDKLLNAIYEILLSKPTDFIREYFTILEGFMWEDFKRDMHSNLRKCKQFSG